MYPAFLVAGGVQGGQQHRRGSRTASGGGQQAQQGTREGSRHSLVHLLRGQGADEDGHRRSLQRSHHLVVMGQVEGPHASVRVPSGSDRPPQSLYVIFELFMVLELRPKCVGIHSLQIDAPGRALPLPSLNQAVCSAPGGRRRRARGAPHVKRLLFLPLLLAVLLAGRGGLLTAGRRAIPRRWAGTANPILLLRAREGRVLPRLRLRAWEGRLLLLRLLL